MREQATSRDWPDGGNSHYDDMQPPLVPGSGEGADISILGDGLKKLESAWKLARAYSISISLFFLAPRSAISISRCGFHGF